VAGDLLAAADDLHPVDIAADQHRAMALAHTIGDKVEAAYRRGELLAKHRELMDDWARYCAG
jgi:hypothetical protein